MKDTPPPSHFFRVIADIRLEAKQAGMQGQQQQHTSATTLAPGRICCTCHVHKDRTEFYNNKKRADGLCKACKPCAKKAIQDHHERAKKKNHKAWTLKHTIAKREQRARKKLQAAAAQATTSPSAFSLCQPQAASV